MQEYVEELPDAIRSLVRACMRQQTIAERDNAGDVAYNLFHHPDFAEPRQYHVMLGDAMDPKTMYPVQPYNIMVASIPFGLKMYDEGPDRQDYLPTEEQLRSRMNNLVTATDSDVFSTVTVCAIETINTLQKVANEFTDKTNTAVVVKRKKPKPAYHPAKQLKLESMFEMVLMTHHSPDGKMSVEHFPRIAGTTMGNVFNDTHRPVKFKSEHDVVINRAEVSGGFWHWVFTTMAKPGDWALVDMCGSGTEVVAALLAGLHVCALDYRQSKVHTLYLTCDLSTAIV